MGYNQRHEKGWYVLGVPLLECCSHENVELTCWRHMARQVRPS